MPKRKEIKKRSTASKLKTDFKLKRTTAKSKLPHLHRKRKDTVADSTSMEPPKLAKPYTLCISNVVCTACVFEPLVLRYIQLAGQSRLDEFVFPSSVSRMKDPETTISFFDTGRILCTGSPSKEYALLSVLLFVEKLNAKLHKNYEIWNFSVQNIVSSFSLGYRLNIDMFYTDNKSTTDGTAHYDPNLFRGCSYKCETGLVFVLFSSGKCVLTGAKDWDQAYNAYRVMVPLLLKYKLGSEYKSTDRKPKRNKNNNVTETNHPESLLDANSMSCEPRTATSSISSSSSSKDVESYTSVDDLINDLIFDAIPGQ